MRNEKPVALVAATLAILCLTPPRLHSRQPLSRGAVRYVGSVDIPGGSRGVTPEDIDGQGQLLLLTVPKSPAGEPGILRWDPVAETPAPPIELRWPGSVAGLPTWVYSLRFLGDCGTRVVGLLGRSTKGDLAVGTRGYILVVISLRRRAALWSVDFRRSDAKHTFASFGPSFLLPVDEQQHRFALFLNNQAAKDPEVFLYTARSSSPYMRWRLPRFVQSAAWSPDGKRLAVLYSGSCDSRLNYYQVDIKRKLLTLPDVAVFDARTGHVDFSFFSGQPEAQIAYSPDGKLLYTIVDSGALPMTFFPHHGRDDIRVFSATDGKLVRTMHVPHTGVRSRFALSPDGKLIAADATTNATWVPHDPPPIAVRFVLLDIATGKRIFEHEETWGGGDATATTLMFSPDGRFLITDPLAATGEGPVEIYKIAGAP
jgi:hypothetical protein